MPTRRKFVVRESRVDVAGREDDDATEKNREAAAQFRLGIGRDEPGTEDEGGDPAIHSPAGMSKMVAAAKAARRTLRRGVSSRSSEAVTRNESRVTGRESRESRSGVPR